MDGFLKEDRLYEKIYKIADTQSAAILKRKAFLKLPFNSQLWR
jgi:hypothetical protein